MKIKNGSLFCTHNLVFSILTDGDSSKAASQPHSSTSRALVGFMMIAEDSLFRYVTSDLSLLYIMIWLNITKDSASKHASSAIHVGFPQWYSAVIQYYLKSGLIKRQDKQLNVKAFYRHSKVIYIFRFE